MASRKETQKRKSAKAFDQSVLNADTFDEWQALAEDYDRQSGGAVWRAKDDFCPEWHRETFKVLPMSCCPGTFSYLVVSFDVMHHGCMLDGKFLEERR